MSTATRLRRRDEDAEIIVIERSGHVSYANCGLAYYLGGVIEDRAELVLQTPESLSSRFRIDVRTNSEVVAIDAEHRRVTVAHADRIYELEYSDLVLATGASPVIPQVPGAQHLLSLRSMEDTDRLDAALSSLRPGAPITIVGAGYIGIELAENLTRRGFAVTLLQRGTQVMNSLDPEIAIIVADALRANGVDLRLQTELTEVAPTAVAVSSGHSIAADLVIAAMGVRADSALAAASGIRTSSGGGIRVDNQHRTSAPHIYAVGDVADKTSAVDGEQRLVTLAGPANREGRYVADSIVGDQPVTPAALGTAILEVFGVTVASTGANERDLRAAGREVRIIHTHPASHAGYYPGAESMSIKLLVDAATDLILGAQIVGGSGIDKRIDVIATAMSAGLTASSLADLELAYAPQFGSAKDAINMLGYVDSNLRDGLSRSIQWHELESERESGAVLIDVRTPSEFEAGSIPGALNIPLDNLRDRAYELGSARIIVHCQVGQRGHTAASLLTHLHLDAVNLDGGYRTWLAGHRARQPQPLGAA